MANDDPTAEQTGNPTNLKLTVETAQRPTTTDNQKLQGVIWNRSRKSEG